ncbi:hypothetical protein O77CONTIG1_04446 [Leptolyngbya sp. O-77]|nr:hypothetical protein O77CONTIG1_04446 [Leptolyngbya sp. O-77]
MVNKPLPREGSVCLTPQENAVSTWQYLTLHPEPPSFPCPPTMDAF